MINLGRTTKLRTQRRVESRLTPVSHPRKRCYRTGKAMNHVATHRLIETSKVIRDSNKTELLAEHL